MKNIPRRVYNNDDNNVFEYRGHVEACCGPQFL